MEIKQIIVYDCRTCTRTEKDVDEILKNYANVTPVIQSVINIKNNILTVSALFIDNELYSHGDINKIKLREITNRIPT